MNNIAKAVGHFRKLRGWSQGQVAKYSGLTSAYIQALEAGQRGENIRHVTLVKLARGLRVAEADLLNFNPSSPPEQLPSIQVFQGTKSSYGSPNDTRLRIINAVSHLGDEQLVMLESFVDWLLERGMSSDHHQDRRCRLNRLIAKIERLTPVQAAAVADWMARQRTFVFVRPAKCLPPLILGR